MPETRRLTQRDLLVALYEANQASKERDAKTQYLLVAILGAVTGTKLVGTPPIVTISFIAVVASTMFAVLILLRAWKHHGPIKYVMGIFLVGNMMLLAGTLGVDGVLMQLVAGLRILFSIAVFYWASTLSVFKKEQIVLEE